MQCIYGVWMCECVENLFVTPSSPTMSHNRKLNLNEGFYISALETLEETGEPFRSSTRSKVYLQ